MALLERGPNINLFDRVRPVRADPMFSAGRTAVPPEWYSANRSAYTLTDVEALYGTLQFARFYGRAITETVSAPSDTAVVANLVKLGYTEDIVETPTDSITRTMSVTSAPSDQVPTPTDTARIVVSSGALINPLVDRWP